jgi:hemerythrin-like domain-containing protein
MAAALTRIMADHHAHCDTIFAAIEADVAAGAWESARQNGTLLREAVEWHFHAEESLLFPALEAATGAGGPAGVMRYEHAQLRELLEAWTAALATEDRAACEENAEALLILLQQHNAKEENILYPMCEQLLGDQGDAIVAQLEAEAQSLCLS